MKQEDFEEYENDNCQLTNVFGIDYKSERKEYDEKYPDKKYPCEICQKQCRGLKGLKTHIKTEHRDIAYFVCSICDRYKTFPWCICTCLLFLSFALF